MGGRLLALSALLFVVPAPAVLAAPAASSSTFHFEEPAFWQRRYLIPRHYQFMTMTFRVARPAESERRAFAQLERFGAVQSPPDDWTIRQSTDRMTTASHWNVPAGRAESAFDGLRHLGTLQYFYRGEYRSTWGDKAGPDPAEIAFKLGSLTSEWRSFGAAAARIPAIAGLLDSQLAALEALQNAEDEARGTIALGLVFSDRKLRSRPPVDQMDWDVRDIRAGQHASLYGGLIAISTAYPAGFWQRTGDRLNCGATDDPLQVTLGVADIPGALESLDHWLKREGAQDVSKDCTPAFYLPAGVPDDVPRATRAAWIDERQLETLRGRLGHVGTIADWDQAGVSVWNAVDSASLTKFELLQRDEEAGAVQLAHAPVLKSFVDAEVARLEPMASAIKATRGRYLVNVLFLPREVLPRGAPDAP